ncbi:MAG TPA: hypothetical protein VM571_12990 [Noviherbaspirillum sp.]|nr:hypothetical protein [Noviherbaspirillum sp.]
MSPDQAARVIQKNFKQYASRMKAQAPDVSAETRQHVHVGDNRAGIGGPAGPGAGLWDGGGLHLYGGLQRRVQSEGVAIQHETTDASHVVQAVVQKPSFGPIAKPNKFPGGQKGHKASEPYTLYPKGVRPLQSDVAGQNAYDSARTARPGTELVPPSGHQPLGRFTGYSQLNDGATKRLVKVQGHYAADGSIGTHYPVKHQPADKHAQQRFEKWSRKNNWQKLQQLGYINPAQAEQMRATVTDKRAQKFAAKFK